MVSYLNSSFDGSTERVPAVHRHRSISIYPRSYGPPQHSVALPRKPHGDVLRRQESQAEEDLGL
jgi:hypothetical protein